MCGMPAGCGWVCVCHSCTTGVPWGGGKQGGGGEREAADLQ